MSLQLIETIIDASPLATLLIDRHGAVICRNLAASEQLGIETGAQSLVDLFEFPKSLPVAIRNALRSSGASPANLRRLQDGEQFLAKFRPLSEQPGQPATRLLVTITTRSRANQKMLALKEQLHLVATERRRLMAQNDELRNTVENAIPQLEALTQTDALTSAYNRRYFDQHFGAEWRRAQRNAAEIALLYIDIDHFKQYNDTFGHPAGDKCLVRVVQALRTAATREFDAICRIGGEEFALVMPATGWQGAISVANRVLRRIRKLALPNPQSEPGILTVSVGVGSCVPRPGARAEDFIATVDTALYNAKHSGRNRFAASKSLVNHTDSPATVYDLPASSRVRKG